MCKGSIYVVLRGNFMKREITVAQKGYFNLLIVIRSFVMTEEIVFKRQNDERVRYLSEHIFGKDSGKPYVFVSYKSDYWEEVLGETIYTLVKDYGLRVYFDKSFDYDNRIWLEQMEENMKHKNCRAIIPFLNVAYATSYATLLELMFSQTKKCERRGMSKPIIPMDLGQMEVVPDDDEEKDTGLGQEIFGVKINKNAAEEKKFFDKVFKELRKRDMFGDEHFVYDPENSPHKGSYLNFRECHQLTIGLLTQLKQGSNYKFEGYVTNYTDLVRNIKNTIGEDVFEKNTSECSDNARSFSQENEISEKCGQKQDVTGDNVLASERIIDDNSDNSDEDGNAVKYTSVTAKETNDIIENALGDDKNNKCDNSDGNETKTTTDKSEYEGITAEVKPDGKRTITYDDGSKYEGKCVDGMAEGRGDLYNPEGRLVYRGNWKGDKYNGIGTYFYEDGKKYIGQFLNGKFNGEGIKYYADGSLQYDGEWSDGVYNGKGTYYYEDGKKYIGLFLKGRFNGRGVKYYADGSPQYDGEWKNGVREGDGKSFYSDGRPEYFGEWKDGTYDGIGTFCYEDGKKYIGQFLKGRFNGRGIKYYDDGLPQYDGEWKDGINNGNGTYYYKDGSKYIGRFENGNYNGKGVMYDAKGRVQYDGDWLNDKKHGEGKYSFADGRSYDGEWKEDKKDGQGIFTWTNGEKYDGSWVADQRHGSGKYVYADGRIFRGVWKNGKRDGAGTEVYKNGDYFEGTWHSDKKDGKGEYIYDGGKKKKRQTWLNGELIYESGEENCVVIGGRSRIGRKIISVDEKDFSDSHIKDIDKKYKKMKKNGLF